MPEGVERVTVRMAVDADLPGIKAIADRERRSLGFVHRAALVRSIVRGEVLVAVGGERIVGFCHYYRLRDRTVTIYHLAVDVAVRQCGAARQMLEHLRMHERQSGATMIRLKCPADLDANGFYAVMGFRRAGIDVRRERHLVLWEWPIIETTR